MTRCIPVLITIVPLLAACSDGGPVDTSDTEGRVYIVSSPNGAEILVDGEATGRVTPDTLVLTPGQHSIGLELDTMGIVYGASGTVDVPGTEAVVDVALPLTGGQLRYFQVAGMNVAVHAAGPLMHELGGRHGLMWPEASGNTYVSATMPVVSGLANGGPVAIGPYDQRMLVGRPAQHVTHENGAFRLTQQAWIVPLEASVLGGNPETVRGILIEQELIADDAVNGVLVVRLTFRNVSADPLYHLFAAHVPAGAVTYTNAWIGMTIDADVGWAADDYVSYDLESDMVFTYDAAFADTIFFEGAGVSAPGLVGLSVLDAPEGTTVLLNSWPRDRDWRAGLEEEAAGHAMLTGSGTFEPDHPHERLGWLAQDTADMRMSVTAGPLTLAPEDEAQIVIAIAVAEPAAGTFSSGTMVYPGDPLDTTRPLYAIAAELRRRMAAAAVFAEF